MMHGIHATSSLQKSCHILVYISHFFLFKGETVSALRGGGGGQVEGLGGKLTPPPPPPPPQMKPY